MLQSTFSVL